MEEIEYNEISQKLIRRFVATSVLLFIIVFTKQLITNQQTEEASETSYIINIAGRQRMLSQKIVKDIVLIEQDKIDVDKKKYQEDLKNSLSTLTSTHEELLEISKENKVFQKNSTVLNDMFEEVEQSYVGMIEEVGKIISGLENNLEDTQELALDVEEVMTQETIYLERMDEIVSKYEERSRESIYIIERTHRILFLFILLVLLFITTRVFKPLIDYLKKAHVKLNESNKNLVKIIQFMKGGFFLADFEGDILFMNEDADMLLANETRPNESLNLINSINWINFDIDELIQQVNVDGSRIEGLESMIEDKEGNILSVMMSAFTNTYDGKKVIVLNIFDFTIQKRAEELLKETIIRDELTGLYNRHVLERILEREFQKADLYDLPLSAILLDLDNFKQINDVYGHPVGDTVLQSIAKTIKNNIRKADYAIRIGGEEILIFMPNTNKKSAAVVAEKIREKISNVVHPDAGRVTASFGVVERKIKEEYLYLYKRVDQALYEAKKVGKNYVKVL